MKGFAAFFAKEMLELVRTKKLLIILIVFIVVGIMNPAVAKLTPALIEMMSEDLASQGMIVGEVTVTALDSWLQFAKNMPAALAALLIMFSGIYTSEYSKGTLIPLLTKGLSRSCVILSKLSAMIIAWSAAMWLCFGLTYFYSDYYWDNSQVHGLLFAGFGWWLFGLLMISCIVFLSSFANSAAQVMIGIGAFYFAMTIAGMLSKIKKYLPTCLLDSGVIFKGELYASDCIKAVIITSVLSVIFVAAAIPLTIRRRL